MKRNKNEVIIYYTQGGARIDDESTYGFKSKDVTYIKKDDIQQAVRPSDYMKSLFKPYHEAFNK